MPSLENRVAIVTGAASGIGRATALLFASQGARVGLADVNEQGGRAVAQEIKKAGGRALFVPTDLSSPVAIEELVGQVLSAYGAVHVLHNNAAVLRTHGTLEETPEDEWRWIIDVDLTSLFLACRAVVPVMKRQGGGAIINMSSLAGLRAYAQGLAYAAAKAGVLGLTRSLAQLLEADRVRVNAICPSGVDTPILLHATAATRSGMTRSGLLRPEDIARAVLYLATREDITGATVAVERRDGKPSYCRVKDFETVPMEGIE